MSTQLKTKPKTFDDRIASREVVQIASIGGIPIYVEAKSAAAMSQAQKLNIVAAMPGGEHASIASN